MSAQTPFQILLEIDQRCRALAAGLPSQQAAVQTWSGIGFRMGERLFVAPMGEVGEVLHEPRYTLLPGVKSWVKGVANVRGRLLPIMDLCGFFGNELSPLREAAAGAGGRPPGNLRRPDGRRSLRYAAFPRGCLLRTTAASRGEHCAVYPRSLSTRTTLVGVQPSCADH